MQPEINFVDFVSRTQIFTCFFICICYKNKKFPLVLFSVYVTIIQSFKSFLCVNVTKAKKIKSYFMCVWKSKKQYLLDKCTAFLLFCESEDSVSAKHFEFWTWSLQMMNKIFHQTFRLHGKTIGPIRGTFLGMFNLVLL